MKRMLKWLRNLLLFLLLQVLALWVGLQTEWGQTWATQHMAGYLSEKLGTRVEVGTVNTNLRSDAILGDVYVEDFAGDTLVFIDEVRLNGFNFNERAECIRIDKIELDRPTFYLHKPQGDTDWNLQFLIDYLATEGSDSSEMCMEVNRIRIAGGRFRLDNDNEPPIDAPRIDWQHLGLSAIDMEADDFRWLGDSISSHVLHLHAREQSGFRLKEFAGLFQMGSKRIVVDDQILRTNNSDLEGRLAFKFKSLEDFTDFETKVRMNCSFAESHLEMGDLAYFSESLEGLEKPLDFSGKIRGRVNNLKVRNLDLRFGNRSQFKGDCDLTGLPEIGRSFISLTVDQMSTNKGDLEAIPILPFTSGKKLKTPDNFAQLGDMRFEGNFTGFLSDFAAYGDLKTAIGAVSADIHLEEGSDTYTFEGRLNTENFDLGKFYSNQTLGSLTSHLVVSGSGLTRDDLDATVVGDIDAFGLNGYTYTGTTVNGQYRQNFFEGDVILDDPACILDFGGKIDFTNQRPTYRFVAEIGNIDLKTLNLYQGAEYSCLSGKATVDGSGFDLDALEGSYVIEELTYCAISDECRLDRVNMTASHTDRGPELTLESSILDADLTGRIDLDKLPLAMEFILADLVPTYPVPLGVREPDEDFDFNLTVKDWTLVETFFLPEVGVAPGTQFHLDLHEDVHDFSVKLHSDSLRYQDLVVTRPDLDVARLDAGVIVDLHADRLALSPALGFDSLQVDAHSEGAQVLTHIDWNTTSEGHAGDLNSVLEIVSIDALNLSFNASEIELNGRTWDLHPDALLQYTPEEIHVENMLIQDGPEFLRVAGDLSTDPRKEMEVELAGFELDNINPFLGDAMEIQGNVSGTASIRDPYEEQLINSDLIVAGFELQEYYIGDVCVESVWDNSTNRLYLNGELKKDDFDTFVFNGQYIPEDEENALDILMTVNRFELDFINTFVDEGVSDLDGTATGYVQVSGTPDKPLLNGELDFDQVTASVDYLGTTYTFAEKATIYPDMFTMDNITVHDQENNDGFLVGTVIHDNFTNWNFDLALFVDEEPFLCMNTTKQDNDLFYGKAYGQGYINVSGYEDHLIFDIELRSGKGTSLALPLEETGEVQFEDFVTFIDPNKKEEKTAVDLSGIELNFGLDITPEAEIMLILDEAVGDVMRGRGQGHLEMSISTLGTFEMVGLIEVLEGNYLFTLKNLINKEFAVRPGGTIAWYGDPIAADLNMEAIYELEAPLYDLLGDENNAAYKNRSPIDLVMELEGNMLTPEIHFDIELPSADDITRSRVNSILSSEEELNRQAFSLLVLKRFVSPHRGGGSAGNALAVNTLEMLSSQMGLWLSDISEDFDIGINYSPGDEISNEEIAIALSTQLFNDRLRISGNFGVSQGNEANQNPSNLIGDIKIEYSITEDGKIRLVVYNETNDYAVATTAQSTYTQGVGVLYQEEFDTIDEFYCGFKNLFRRESERSPCR